MSKQVKRDRGALRQIVKEELPGILKEIIFQEMRKDMNGALADIGQNVNATMQRMQERQVDLQSYIMREVSAATMAKVAPKEATDESK